MRKLYILWLIGLTGSITHLSFAEEITLTTYYPAPFGVYDQMVTDTLGVGDTNGDSDLTGADAPPAADSGNVWIAGNVGIGLTNPTEKLEMLGKISLETDTTTHNVIIGKQAGFASSISAGGGSTFLGYRAGYSNTTGLANTFLGNRAGYYNTENGGPGGNNNTFLGRRAGYKNTVGTSNLFVGMDSGYSNTIGSDNTFIGSGSGIINSSGRENSFFGYLTSRNNSVGNYNVAMGAYAGYRNSNGSGNVFIGYRAGYSETGSDKLYISNSGTVNPLIYGDFGSDQLTINGAVFFPRVDAGSGVNLVIDGAEVVRETSSRRYKEEITDLEIDTNRIYALRPVSFTWKRQGKRDFGLIAEEVGQILPELVTYDRDGRPDSVKYKQLSVLLLKELKELKAIVAEQQEAIAALPE